MKTILIAALVAIVGLTSVLVLLPAGAATNSVPTPPTSEPPAPPDGWAFVETPTNGIEMIREARYQWELTFEHSTDASFTNVTVYPIVIRVPFEYEQGFVRVVARKGENK